MLISFPLLLFLLLFFCLFKFFFQTRSYYIALVSLELYVDQAGLELKASRVLSLKVCGYYACPFFILLWRQGLTLEL